MRFARVIGRVTLNVSDPSYTGGRFLIGMPCGPATPAPKAGEALLKGDSLVIFDKLGATQGDLVAYTDGGEAAAPFMNPTPCDAFNAAIIDNVYWKPSTNR